MKYRKNGHAEGVFFNMFHRPRNYLYFHELGNIQMAFQILRCVYVEMVSCATKSKAPSKTMPIPTRKNCNLSYNN